MTTENQARPRVLGIGSVSTLMLAASLMAPAGRAAEPATVIVVVNVQEKDFVSRVGVLLRKRNIPMLDFDFKAAFTQELMSRLAGDKHMQYRLAKPEDGIPNLPPPQPGTFSLPLKLYKEAAAAKPDAGMVLRVDIEAVGAITGLGTSYYTLTGAMVMVSGKGKVLWSQGDYIGPTGFAPDWQIKVDGSVDAHQADNQKLMKENIDKIIEKYCASKVGKLQKKEFKD
jgi:hypothetical protein